VSPIKFTAHYSLIEKAIEIVETLTNQNSDNLICSELQLSYLSQQLHISTRQLKGVLMSWAGISTHQFFKYLEKQHVLQLIFESNHHFNKSKILNFKDTKHLNKLILQVEMLTPDSINSQGNKPLQLVLGQTSSPLGQVFACFTNQGLNNLEFETNSLNFSQWRENIKNIYPLAKLIDSNTPIESLVKKIFYDSSSTKENLILHLLGTSFEHEVWQALLSLSLGDLTSYQQIARMINKPKASRAVGCAIAKNPVGFLIPCHRVVLSSGEFGQYRWNKSRKKAMHLWEHGLLNAVQN
jgi:AraC family transcriptional regulator of adaptative response/methylated-DNA-[protein]-cysteine methyltransferase